MTEDTPALTEEDLQEIARLHEQALRDLHFGQTARAAEVAQALAAKYPRSTTAQETLGDVLAAQGKREEAKAAYRRALDLEPANADAERKFAELSLILSEAERTRRMLQTGDLRQLRGMAHKDPTRAATRSLFFPGLGQLYNGDYERGLVVVLVAMPLFGMAMWGIVAYIASLHPRDPQPMSVLQIAAAVLGVLGYCALVAWSAWDAWRSAREVP